MNEKLAMETLERANRRRYNRLAFRLKLDVFGEDHWLVYRRIVELKICVQCRTFEQL